MKFAIIRLTKSMFIKLRLHVVVEPFTGALLKLVYLSKLSRWAYQHKNIPGNDFYSSWDYNKRFQLYSRIIEQEQLTSPVNYLEFGVAGGHSFNWWMTENTHRDSRFYGFDTFTGLPEDFGPYKKGYFNSGSIPAVKDDRGKLYQGLFQQTLPGFLSGFNNSMKKVIMLDADLYTATLFVLTSIAPYLKKGDISLFAEFVFHTHRFIADQICCVA